MVGPPQPHTPEQFYSLFEMSGDSSTGDASPLPEMIVAPTGIESHVAASAESATNTDQGAPLEDLEFEREDSGNETLCESQLVDQESPKTAIYQPIPQGSRSLPKSLDHLAFISGQDLSFPREHKEPDGLQEFKENYSEKDETPSVVVKKIVDFLEYTQRTAARVRDRNNSRTKELEKRVRDMVKLKDDLRVDIFNYQDTIQNLKDKNDDLEGKNSDLRGIIGNQNKKWEEVDKQLRAHPEISFSFVGPNKETTGSLDSGKKTQAREVDQTTGLDDMPKGHKRDLSTTPIADLLLLTLSLEADITRLKVTNLFGRARDSFLKKNPNETLVLAQEIADICNANGLGQERTLFARSLFWRAQAQGQLNMWTEAHHTFTDAISLGLGPNSNCLEGDQVENLVINSRLKLGFGETRTYTDASENYDGGTPDVGSLATNMDASERYDGEIPSVGSLVT